MPKLFNDDANRRIAEAVKKIERLPPLPPPAQPPKKTSGDEGFWARLTSVDYSTGRYAWTRLKPKDDGTGFDEEASVTGTTSTGYAKDRLEFKFVPINTRVFLTFRAGYFIFDWDARYVLGRADAEIASNASGTVSVYTEAVSDTTQNITVVNKSDSTIGSNDFILCYLIGSVWFSFGVEGEGRGLEFSLPSTLTTSQGSKASCPVVYYWGGPNPGSTVTVVNLAQASNYLFRGNTGDHGLAVWDSTNSVWRITSLKTSAEGESSWFVQFELNATKAPTASTAFSTTTITYWGGGDPGSPLDIVDNPLVGGLYAHMGFDGDRGLAVYDDTNDVWRMLNLRNTAPREFTASLTGTMQSGDPVGGLGSLVALDGGPSPSLTEADNKYALAACNGSEVLVKQNLATGDYFIAQITHTLQEMVIDVEYDDVDHKWTKEYVEVAVSFDCVSGPTDEDILSLTDVEVDIDVAATTGDLKETKRTIWVADAETAEEPEVVWEMELCEVVTDVDVDAGAMELWRKETGIVAWSVGEEGEEILIDAGTDCAPPEEEEE